WGTKLYVVHASMSSRSHEIIDVATGKHTRIRSDDVRTAKGRFVVDRNFNLIDLDTATIVGQVSGAISVNAAGHVLRAGADRSGPMRWAAPSQERCKGRGYLRLFQSGPSTVISLLAPALTPRQASGPRHASGPITTSTPAANGMRVDRENPSGR